jgi:hypothetical protein
MKLLGLIKRRLNEICSKNVIDDLFFWFVSYSRLSELWDILSPLLPIISLEYGITKVLQQELDGMHQILVCADDANHKYLKKSTEASLDANKETETNVCIHVSPPECSTVS